MLLTGIHPEASVGIAELAALTLGITVRVEASSVEEHVKPPGEHAV